MNTTTRPAEGFWVLGHRARPLATIGDYGLVEIVSDPGVPGPPPHHHEGVSEFFYVAEGTLDVQVDGRWRTLQAGESLCLEPGQVHTLTNRGDAPTRWITGWSPRGFEQFFVDFGVDVQYPDGQSASVAPEMIARVQAECGHYGMVVARTPKTSGGEVR